MADGTAIEWTDATVNPIRARNIATGKLGWHCTRVSDGCRNCYATGMNRRLGTGLDYQPQSAPQIEIFLDDKILMKPLRWRRGRRIFISSTTDIFADFVPDDMLDRIFTMMALAPQHTFQVLTKRPERMRDYLGTRAGDWWAHWPDAARKAGALLGDMPAVGKLMLWPLPNVWLGVSAEDQKTADERIPHLLATPAAVRFVSAEPLLGPIDFTRITWGDDLICGSTDALGGIDTCLEFPGEPRPSRAKLDWIIVGGESGSKARPMHPDWVRSIRDQCAAAGVPFFFKQWGEWREVDGPKTHKRHRKLGAGTHFLTRDGKLHPRAKSNLSTYREYVVARLGKKAAGRLLDGREHNAMPGGAS